MAHNGVIRKKAIVPFVSFLLLMILCRLFPYTGDDWAWGSQIGIDRLLSSFHDYGGRYLGYLIVLGLTRSVWLRAITMAFVITGICLCIQHIAQREYAFEISLLMLLCTPKMIFRQAIVWTSGFSNYMIASFFSILFTTIFLRSVEKAQFFRHRFFSCILMFFLGLANTLVLENMTVYNLFISLFVIIVIAKRCKRNLLPFILHFFGTICGAALMFSNSAYHQIASSADGYRTILSGGLIRQIATNYFHNIYLYGFRDNTILNLCLLSVCAVAVFLMYRNNLKVRGYVKVCFFLFTCYVLYALFISLYVSTSRGIYAIVIDGIFAFLALFFLYLLSFTIGKSSGDKNIQFSIYYTLLSIVLIIAPLFIVNPIGPRCFISSYIYFILLLCLLIKSCKSGIIKSGIINTMQRSMRTLCLVASCAIFFVYFGMFLKIHNTDIDRIDYIQTQVAQGRNEVEILHFDYESYLWTATPEQGSIWEYRYKLFYDIPESVSLTPVWKYS